MGMMEDRAEKAAEAAKRLALDRKREVFRSIRETFLQELDMLDDTLKCIGGTSENVTDAGVWYTLTVDRSRFKNAKNKKLTEMRWEFYREAVAALNEKLGEGIVRRKLYPFWFKLEERTTGKVLIAWHFDEKGVFQKDN